MPRKKTHVEEPPPLTLDEANRILDRADQYSDEDASRALDVVLAAYDLDDEPPETPQEIMRRREYPEVCKARVALKIKAMGKAAEEAAKAERERRNRKPTEREKHERWRRMHDSGEFSYQDIGDKENPPVPAGTVGAAVRRLRKSDN
jgi:hypothetical protein